MWLGFRDTSILCVAIFTKIQTSRMGDIVGGPKTGSATQQRYPFGDEQILEKLESVVC